MANFKFLLLPFYDFSFQIEESITYVKASYHASTKKRTYDVYVCNSKSDDRDSQVVYMYGYWQCPIG
jgi:hypothetical protein